MSVVDGRPLPPVPILVYDHLVFVVVPILIEHVAEVRYEVDGQKKEHFSF